MPRIRNTSGLIPFEKGQSGNPNGRPKKLVTLAKDAGYNIQDINDTLKTLLACNIADLKTLGSSEEATVLETIVCKALLKSRRDGDLRTLESILSRVFGHPKQSFEATITEQPIFPDDDDDPDYSPGDETAVS